MLLLDSHVALWSVASSRQIGPHARARIEAASVVHISAATIWELQIKAMLGKVRVPDGLRARLRDQGFVELPVTGEHAEAIQKYPELIKHDPFDRLLLAQASTTGLELLTTDRVLLALGLDFVVNAQD
jgi:PIN domain nuclease of toxin-antitoxin system